jgi:hypothetical protein
VWCLVTLEGRSRTSFFYLGPHDLWKDFPDADNKSPDHEADLICVVDGRVHLCEVKSSARDIDIASLVEVAQRIRPDTVTLAVMESASTRLEARLTELKLALDGTGIEAELLTHDASRERDDACLP